MTTTCLSQVSLHYVDATSDKLYIIQVQEQEVSPGVMQYQCVSFYGRRGNALSIAPKPVTPSLAKAQADANKQEREKRGKGYGNWSGPATSIPGLPATAPKFGGPATPGAPAATPAPTAPKIVGISPMLAEVLTEADLEAKLTDSNWAMQKEQDGERVPVSMRRNGLTATNKKGVVRPLTANAEEMLKKLLARPDFGDEMETVIDGELLGDDYIVYDIVTLRDNDVKELSYAERYSMLEELFADQEHLLAETAWSEEDKRAMLDRARTEAWEGVMFREVNSGYVHRRTKVLLKFKLWATVTCRVLSANSGKRSIEVALREADGSETSCGNVTVKVNQDTPDPDDLVEVRYLYATKGGQLYQTELLRVRDDQDEADLRSTVRMAPPEKRGAVEPEPASSAELEPAI